ncbi:chromate transporter [Nibricoccus aquaticus]|uniref:Chromate transporter n=1 Tax=Nibricoccus aquaticus TaxID=2576891 RepID=A0A290Q534_9BACT|nr:chromate efflux transporter [Nibricoccus aquaticus]ATC63543.1 chromate transporter [Nibricoccus aquaticus]
MSQAVARPSFREALKFWLKLGFISFGGPAGQIAIMHEELVERKGWIGEKRFLHALNFCMLLPGPEATQLAVYCGWLLHRTWGGIVAGVLFVLPAALLLWALSWVYVSFGHTGWLAGAFYGLKPAVTAVVAAAVLRIGKRALKTPGHWALAAGAFVAIFFLRVPFPAVVVGALAIGFVSARAGLKGFGGAGADGELMEAVPDHARASVGRAVKVLGVSLVLWWTPVMVAGLWQGWDGTLAKEGVFFSQTAMVTFGGAYAVLPYVGQQAVEVQGWLTAAQMLDGLGLAETTPGPLIMVVQFVGFLGGWNQPGEMSPLMAATLGAAITTWTTFVPCFLWIFLGAPYLERVRGNAALSGALAAVTAAVVGVVLNLAVWFGWQVFHPREGVIDWFAVGLAAVAFAALQRWKGGMIAVLAACGVCGWGWKLLGT